MKLKFDSLMLNGDMKQLILICLNSHGNYWKLLMTLKKKCLRTYTICELVTTVFKLMFLSAVLQDLTALFPWDFQIFRFSSEGSFGFVGSNEWCSSNFSSYHPRFRLTEHFTFRTHIRWMITQSDMFVYRFTLLFGSVWLRPNFIFPFDNLSMIRQSSRSPWWEERFGDWAPIKRVN